MPEGSLREISDWRQTLKREDQKTDEPVAGMMEPPNRSMLPGSPDPDQSHGSMAMVRASILRADLRIKEAKANQEEHKFSEAVSDLVRLSDVQQFFSELFTEMRSQALRIPQEMKTAFPKKVRQSLTEDLNARLELYLRSIHSYVSRMEELK